ncbi:protein DETOXIFICATION 42-like isoform X1 [Phalaenopsis equestris]|uniref:protein DETOXIFICATION 42-like isoform X1 n=1 Tax=Phalaenopsis equestris TaxID=78828 RepID=UPI0009E656C3|nr:protein DETOXIFICATION 42-like isoform X1 [Phalaenopsis equestris]XP_020590763.1 protein DETOXIFICATION 42-like isoform X1 [Phalaenopsis equestris]
MENILDASNKVLSVQDNPLEQTQRTPHVVNESETATSDETAAAIPILSLPGTWRKVGIYLFFKDICCIFKLDELGREVARIAIPAAMALAADPLASLVDTAFIGRLGSVELAAVGVSIAIFNQVSKVAIYPLVSVTTSFVAEEDAVCCNILEEKGNFDLEKASAVINKAAFSEVPDARMIGCDLLNIVNTCSELSTTTKNKRKFVPSVSTALVVGAVLGILQAILLIATAKFVLHLMGVKGGSPMLAPAMRYLTLRSLGAPAVLLSLAMQGVFRGFKDTKTPLYATMAGDLTNIILDPILIFVFHMGISGAAIAHVISQYFITLILLCKLIKKVDIVPQSIKSFKFARFLRCGFLLLARVIAVTFCVTLAASLAAHHGPTPMAAFQICLQVWLSTSLLADGLAVAGQAILASAFAMGDLPKVVAATSRVLQLSIVLGLVLSGLLGVGLGFGSGIFTKDRNVIKQVHKAIPFVAGTQTINSLAFVFDGINFGASDYTFSAYSMVAVAAVSIPSLIFLSNSYDFVGIWIALTIYMSLRTFASLWRMGSATGPWTFIRK